MLCILLAVPAAGQEWKWTKELPPGGFRWMDQGTFLMEGRKYFGENAYEKAFDWDGRMAFGFRAVAYDRTSFWPYFMFQPVVARSYDRRIRVSGQVYHLAGSIRYEMSRELTASLSLVHLSTHITQDIEHPFYADLPQLPPGLLDDANVISIGVSGRNPPEAWTAFRWALELQPIDVMLPNVFDNRHYVRPVYFFVESVTWKDSGLQLTASAEGELGDKKQSVAKLETRLGFLNAHGEERLQIFVDKFFAPYDVSSSPRLGFFPVEFALGLRFEFKAL